MSAVANDSLPGRLAAAYCAVTRQIDKLQPLLLLIIRLYVARVFLMSGLTKIHDWSVTVALFTDEYHVPLLSPGVAALMGTATELSMPILLALGLPRVSAPSSCSFSTSSPWCRTRRCRTWRSRTTTCGAC